MHRAQAFCLWFLKSPLLAGNTCLLWAGSLMTFLSALHRLVACVGPRPQPCSGVLRGAACPPSSSSSPVTDLLFCSMACEAPRGNVFCSRSHEQEVASEQYNLNSYVFIPCTHCYSKALKITSDLSRSPFAQEKAWGQFVKL